MNADVTITQIARESGVSIATVSRFLNGRVAVSPEKRARIEAVIKKYDYRPNALAQSLISKKTMTLGVVLPDISNPYFSSLFLEIQQAALKEGYSILLCNTRFHGGKESHTIGEEDYFETLMNKKVDGALILGGQVDLCQPSAPYQEALERLNRSLPVVVMGAPVSGSHCIFIDLENGSGVTTAFHYLYSLGHRKIAFLGGQPGVTITSRRINAFEKAWRAAGLCLSSDYVVLSDYYAQDGYQGVLELLTRSVPFTAILAMNDNVARGAVRGLMDRGIYVPGDKALISCDHFDSSNYFVPRITGIRRPDSILGPFLIRTLLDAMEGITGTAKLSFPPELTIQESCGTNRPL